MGDPETAMLAFCRLARISHDRIQMQGRDRFLLLAGVAACRAGWPEIAEHCRQLIVAHNPRHFLATSATLPDALRDDANAGFFQKASALCSFEQAEHLLTQHGGVPVVTDKQTAADLAETELAGLAA